MQIFAGLFFFVVGVICISHLFGFFLGRPCSVLGPCSWIRIKLIFDAIQSHSNMGNIYISNVCHTCTQKPQSTPSLLPNRCVPHTTVWHWTKTEMKHSHTHTLQWKYYWRILSTVSIRNIVKIIRIEYKTNKVFILYFGCCLLFGNRHLSSGLGREKMISDWFIPKSEFVTHKTHSAVALKF